MIFRLVVPILESCLFRSLLQRAGVRCLIFTPRKVPFRSAAIFSTLSWDRTRRMNNLTCSVVTCHARVCSEMNMENTAPAFLSLREMKCNWSNPSFWNTGINYTSDYYFLENLTSRRWAVCGGSGGVSLFFWPYV